MDLKIPAFRAVMSTRRENPNKSKVFSEEWDKETFNANRGFFSLPRANLGRVAFTGMPLLYLIKLTDEAEATDPRDRLFVLLGLANNQVAIAYLDILSPNPSALNNSLQAPIQRLNTLSTFVY